jgi:hypothetical protein
MDRRHFRITTDMRSCPAELAQPQIRTAKVTAIHKSAAARELQTMVLQNPAQISSGNWSQPSWSWRR